MYYSQYNQDQFIFDNFFKNSKNNGVFIDIGAHDGKTFSNSFFFEQTLNWDGICFEPNPDIFPILKNNRKCLCIMGGVSDKGDEVLKYMQIKGDGNMLSGFVSKYDKRHVKRIEQHISLHGGSKSEIDVKTFNLNDVLEENNFKTVDYLSIDTEGGELEILKSINFKNVIIKVLSVENNYRDRRLNKIFGDPMVRFMVSKGFKKIKEIKCDDIYINENVTF